MAEKHSLYLMGRPRLVLTDNCIRCGEEVKVKDCSIQLDLLCKTCYESYKQKSIQTTRCDFSRFD